MGVCDGAAGGAEQLIAEALIALTTLRKRVQPSRCPRRLYQRPLSKELQAAGLGHEREVWIPVYYKGEKLGRKRVDFVVEACMVETKAKSAWEDAHYVQTLSYLKASGYEVGLLINFGGARLEVRRLINTKR